MAGRADARSTQCSQAGAELTMKVPTPLLDGDLITAAKQLVISQITATRNVFEVCTLVQTALDDLKARGSQYKPRVIANNDIHGRPLPASYQAELDRVYGSCAEDGDLSERG
jgi:hypothetical protein